MQPDPDVLDPSGELSAHIKAQTEEYGRYVAVTRIYAGSTLAYDIGHPVPVSNVVRHGYFHNGQVKLVDGKEPPPEVAATLPTEPDPTPAPAEATPADESTVDTAGVFH